MYLRTDCVRGCVAMASNEIVAFIESNKQTGVLVQKD
jgi:hypothetical protein